MELRRHSGRNGEVWFSDKTIYPGELPTASTLDRLPVEGPGRDLPSA